MTTFVDLEQKDQYGNSGFVTHKKNEGEENAPILGNCKIFWDSQEQSNKPKAVDFSNINNLNDDEITF